MINSMAIKKTGNRQRKGGGILCSIWVGWVNWKNAGVVQTQFNHILF